MDLSKAKLGEQYLIYIDEIDNCIITVPSKIILLATIIAKKKPAYGQGWILGWKENETRPSDSYQRGVPSLQENEYVANECDYVYARHVRWDLTIHSLYFTVKKSLAIRDVDGMACRRCLNFYHYAVPNQKDGTLLCWSCRH